LDDKKIIFLLVGGPL